MLSLFCDMLCVLAQPTNDAAHPTAILVRKKRVVGFIGSDLPLVPDSVEFCNPEVEMGGRKGN